MKDSKTLFPYQLEGIKLITEKFKDVLLADHPGAGKTCQAIISASNIQAKKILVVCPASLRENWRREFLKWSEYRFFDLIYASMHKINPAAEVVICSYALVDAVHGKFDLIIYDEAHFLKNNKSIRTKKCLTHIWEMGERHILITGTPLPNGRAIEGFTVFSKLAPKVFGGIKQYIANFCIKQNTPWGISYNKSKNLDKLGKLCRENFMIRRERQETIGQLPPLIRIKVPLDSVQYEDEEDLIHAFNDNDESLFTMPRFKSERANHGSLKVNASLDFIFDLLLEVKNCVVFAHHKHVINFLRLGLMNRAISFTQLTGESTPSERQYAIDTFQEGNIKVFLASLMAANTGITLTASSNIVFVESDWVPSNNEQAEGRCYRVSQTEVTRSHYLVIPDSLDELILESVLKKQRDITKVLGD